MSSRRLVVALTVAGLTFAGGCGSNDSGSPVAATSTPRPTVTAPPTPSAITSTPTVTIKTSASPTSTSSTTVNPANAEVCRKTRNALQSAGLIDPTEQAIKGENVNVLAFATPIDSYRPVDVGSADPKIADPVIRMNKAIAILAAGSFSQWTDAQTGEYGSAYKLVKISCTAAEAWS